MIRDTLVPTLTLLISNGFNKSFNSLSDDARE